MRRRTISLFKPTLLLPLSRHRPIHPTPPPFSNLLFAQNFSFLITTLTSNPSNPKLLSSLDSLLASTHLLDSTTSLLVIRGLALTKKLVRAKSLLTHLKNKATLPDTFLYSLVLQCLLPIAPIHAVQSVWAQISGSSHEPINTPSRFIIHLCRHGGANHREMENFYSRISSSRWGLTHQAYSSLIVAMCGEENPNPGLARAVLREMEERGFEDDGSLYSILFESFCGIGDLSEADSVLRNMIERKNCELGVSIYGNFLYGLCKTGKIREARKLFDKLTKRGDQVVEADRALVLKPGRRVIFQLAPQEIVSYEKMFAAYFRALCSAGKVNEAELLLKEAMKKNTVLDECTRSSFVEVLFRNGRVDDAIRFFEAEKKRCGCTAQNMVAAVVGLCEMGRVDDGRRLLDEAVDSGFVLTAQVWNHILRGYWDVGRVEDAMQLFDEMTQSFSGHARPDASTYSAMINGVMGKGDIRMASSLIEEAVRKNIRVDVGLHGAVASSLYAHRGVEVAFSFRFGSSLSWEDMTYNLKNHRPKDP